MSLYCIISAETQAQINRLRSECAERNGFKDGKFRKEMRVVAPVEFHFIDGKPHHVEYLGSNLGAFQIRLPEAECGEDGVRYLFRCMWDGTSAAIDIQTAHHVLLLNHSGSDGAAYWCIASSHRLVTDGEGTSHRTPLHDYSYYEA